MQHSTLIGWFSPILRWSACCRASLRRTLRAVRDGHDVIAPHLPFGWVEEPPSINRPLGLAWLSGREPVLRAAISNAIPYGGTLSSAERDTGLHGVAAIHP